VKTKNLVLLSLFIGIILLLAGYLLINLVNERTYKILVSTDKYEYRVGEKIHIHIQNFDDRSIEIDCPMTCAQGNFPTTLEKFDGVDWVYFAGFCPSIEPSFGSSVVQGDYIVHSLAPGDSYDLEISNLGILNIQQEVRLRIMYYMNHGKATLYSNSFSLKP